MEYQYPIDPDWSTDEIVDVINFFECVEDSYEKGTDREGLLNAYRRFKEIVPGKSQEKKICDEFEQTSGYSAYLTVKAGKESVNKQIIKMK